MNEGIVRAAIYPAIGVARVGNSEEEYFFGPEVPDNTEIPGSGFKDESGALKRQAARFRIYGFDAKGNVIRELTLSEADIKWRVQVANTKAAWYDFESPMDIPSATPVPRRNPGVTGSARAKLRIEPVAEEISGRNQKGRGFHGEFMGAPVYLGELQTDADGRLIFLGGRGSAGTPDAYNYIADLANNRWWYDDVSDGPVTAQVKLKGGGTIPVEPAWVVTAPPNYSPHTPPIRSLYDVMFEAFQRYWPQPAGEVSLKRDVLPILKSLVWTQWLNKGFFLEFGWSGRYNHNFLRRDYLEKLGSKREAFKQERTRVLNLMRRPGDADLSKHLWPQIYGDHIDSYFPVSMLALTQPQYTILQRWAEGDFIEDADLDAEANEGVQGPKCIEDIALELRPDLLTETALRNCSGGPFHTGCEMTWVMRKPVLFYKPFRIRHRRQQDAEPDFGDTLTPTVAIAKDGPLYGSGPGDITRWMSVPWHCDVAGCGSGYSAEYDPYLPSLWPASVPNQVLTEEQLGHILDEATPREQRLQEFGERAEWMRFTTGGILAQMQQMVTDYGKAGVVVRRKVKPVDSELPQTVFVETETGFPPKSGE
jgi:hypothetical protein